MKNKDLRAFLSGLHAVNELRGLKFVYAVSRNMDRVQAEMKRLAAQTQPPASYIEYDKKRVVICEQFCKKDESGELLLKDGHYDIEDMPAFQVEFDKLKEQNKTALDDYNKHIEEVAEFLEEEAIIDVYQISMDVVPEDINAGQLQPIMAMIKE